MSSRTGSRTTRLHIYACLQATVARMRGLMHPHTAPTVPRQAAHVLRTVHALPESGDGDSFLSLVV